MKTIITALAAATTVAWLAASLPAAAQAQPKEIFIYATYFHCNKAIYYRADESVTRLYGPELNGMVKEKLVSSWGWLGKSTGGEWERAGYFTGPSLRAVLGASSQLQVRSDWRQPVRDLAEACGSSEDYIWHVLAGNDGRGHLGKVAFSTYYVCDQGRETQVDTEVKRDFAPKYDKLVAAGKLTSWVWAEQTVGGKYRRLSTMSAPAVESLIAAREEVVLDKAVSAICESHQDYIWDVKDQGHD
jgi:hypothetical protein